MLKPQLALQLYTLRDALANDFAGTLDRVAGLGFNSVETAFFPANVTIRAAASAIRHAGLTVSSAHCEIPLGDQKKSVLEMADLFETDLIIWHGWPQDPKYQTVDGIHRLAQMYNEANEVCVTANKRFGIHNHWWEFQVTEGLRPYKILGDEMDPAIFFELDTYWAQTAGVDPAVVITEMGDRVPLLHVKDGPATIGDNMVALGQGTMDFKAILEAASGHVKWLIIELDRCETDMFEAVAHSRNYLIASGFCSP